MDKYATWLTCGGVAAGVVGLGLATDERL